ncbi:Flavin-dependent tryptophan halogenase RebH (plasmid) [Asticcacaulis sp. MM231]|uniref:tryptophan halogenase family protein n=1 Tax=Asticcacaulis sp. MM231 TaxID=3157666 RepID=UPI0032D5AEDA
MKKVIIAGGGTAGWMAAASLAHQLAHLDLDITLIELSDIGKVGVGEATVPAIRDYIGSLGLDIFDVMRDTQATAKLGIRFDDWSHDGDSFFHPFGLYGVPAGQTAFHHLCHRLREAGEDTPLAAYNLCTQLALAERFTLPNLTPKAAFEAYDWAIHFDAGLFAQCLRTFATRLGVKRIDARIHDVAIADNGHIKSLRLDDGRDIEGELFIDCSGFRALLIRGALKSGYQNWQKWLPCNRAVALPCERTGPLTPYTRSTALSAGWAWRIPLQHRVGNGYVYSSDHLTQDEAETGLRSRLEGPALASANHLRFVTGHATEVWKANCVAIGLAAGFLEPLESTSIVLIQTGIEKLIKLFPGRGLVAASLREYNRTTTLEYERVRDFIILHYWASGRKEPMWKACQAMALPDHLQQKIDVFRASGHLVRYEWESFHDPSWLSMYAGFGINASSRDLTADRFDVPQLRDICTRMTRDIQSRVASAETHAQFLARSLRVEA